MYRDVGGEGGGFSAGQFDQGVEFLERSGEVAGLVLCRGGFEPAFEGFLGLLSGETLPLIAGDDQEQEKEQEGKYAPADPGGEAGA